MNFRNLPYSLAVLCLFAIGCGESQPPALKNAVVTIKGPPNGELYASMAWKSVFIEGRGKSTSGSTLYGKFTLDENGEREFKPESETDVHGLELVIVGLNDSKLTFTAQADELDPVTGSVQKAFDFKQAFLGYQTDYDPNDPRYTAPEDHIAEAKQSLEDAKESTDNGADNQQAGD